MAGVGLAAPLVPEAEKPTPRWRRLLQRCRGRCGGGQASESDNDDLEPPRRRAAPQAGAARQCLALLFDRTRPEDFDWLEWLPEWGSDARARRKAHTGFALRGEKLTFYRFAGPAVKRIAPVVPVLWCSSACYPFFVWMVSDCPDPLQPFARYPPWVWLPYLTFVFVPASICEWSALKLITPTYAMWVMQFQVLGQRMSFLGWCVITAVLSSISKVDVLTNGLFLATILKTCSCREGLAVTIMEAWRKTIQESVVWWVPCFDDIAALVTMSWLLMFIQPVGCVIATYPRKGLRNTSFAEKSETFGYLPLKTVLVGKSKAHHTYHADTLKMVAFVLRMTSLVDQSVAWTMKRAESERKWERAADILSREIRRIHQRLWMFTLFERAWMLEVQTSIFALSRSLMQHDRPWYDRVNGQMAITIFFTVASFSKELVNILSQLVQLIAAKNALHDSGKLVHDEHGNALPHDTLAAAAIKEEAENRMHGGLRCLVIGFFLLMMMLGHSMLKLIMAFGCEDSLWDIPKPWDGGQDVDAWGCVLHLAVRGAANGTAPA